MKSSVHALLGTLLLITTVGCGQGQKSALSNSGNNESKEAHIEEQLKAAEAATKEAQVAIDLAQEAIDTLMDKDGNIKIGLFIKGPFGDIGGDLATPVVDFLRPIFDEVYEKLLEVTAKYAKARLALTEAIDKLDPSNPAHALIIEKLNKQIARLDALEAKFTHTIHKLAGKLDLVVDALDKLIKGITTFIPGFGPIAGFIIDWFIMDDVKALVFEFKQKLLAL